MADPFGSNILKGSVGVSILGGSSEAIPEDRREQYSSHARQGIRKRPFGNGEIQIGDRCRTPTSDPLRGSLRTR